MNIVVDSHQHFWDPAAFPLPNFLPEQQVLNRAYLPKHLKPELDKAGVSYVVAVQALPQNLDNNLWLFDLAEKTDFIAGIVAWVDLTRPADLADVLDDLKARPLFCGVRHIVEMEEDNWLIKEEVLVYLRDVYDHVIQAIDTIETFRDMLSAMLDIYLSSVEIE